MRDWNPGLPDPRADFSTDTLLILLYTGFAHLFIYSFQNYLLSTYYTPGTVLGSMDAAVNKACEPMPSGNTYSRRRKQTGNTHIGQELYKYFIQGSYNRKWMEVGGGLLS